MQHPVNSIPTLPTVATPESAASSEMGTGDGAPRALPDAQLWRDAIGAARRAAASAAELRSALEASRPARNS